MQPPSRGLTTAAAAATELVSCEPRPPSESLLRSQGGSGLCAFLFRTGWS